MTKALVLLSGGQDSTTCLYWAKKYYDEVFTASFSYGQRHVAELQAMGEITKLAAIPVENMHVVSMGFLGRIGGSALVDRTDEIKADGGYGDKEAPNGLPTSFVPGRNLAFLTAAAALAVKLGIKTIVTGVCQTDYSGYPDCRREFIDSFVQTANLAMPSSAGPFEVKTPLMYLSKADTVRLARTLPGCWEALALSVTCYHGQRPGCGVCPACVLRMRGFADAFETDPARA